MHMHEGNQQQLISIAATQSSDATQSSETTNEQRLVVKIPRIT